MKRAQEKLSELQASVQTTFLESRNVLSFGEYLELVLQDPYRYTRDAARYVRDAILHFGSSETTAQGFRKFRIFDSRIEGEPHVIGQAAVQEALFRALENFVREGRVNRVLLLHGPNGSAKSTMVACIMRGMENYARAPEGAVYSFSWVFPRGKDGRAVGFGSSDESYASSDSYAHLPDASIELRLPSDLRENPLMVLPRVERQAMLEDAFQREKVSDPIPAAWLGELSGKNRMIFDALLSAYKGDLRRVLSHVRVERWYVSLRYRAGAVVLGSQMAVDAHERQISVDRSLGALPASLTTLSLFEPRGDLVDASGGVFEFSDLLKRPIDAWRYLLLAVESNEVALQTMILPLNVLFVATSNDVHLRAFREHHEYRSFRGRLSLIHVPYLLDHRDEEAIYQRRVIPQLRVHVAPHAVYVLALWAVLSRLRRSRGEHFPSERIARLAAELTPIEKAEIYSEVRAPKRLTRDEARDAMAARVELMSENFGELEGEGLSGASPRELRLVLLDATQDSRFDYLSPQAVLAQLHQLCERGDYDYLKITPDGSYGDARLALEVVRSRWLDRVEQDFRSATGIVDDAQFVDHFERYIVHVSHAAKQENILNQVTHKLQGPDEALMRSVEEKLGYGDRSEEFRRELIGKLAGHVLDHPGEMPRFDVIFADLVERLREASYRDRRVQLSEILEDSVAVLSSDSSRVLTAERKQRVDDVFKRATTRGYQEKSWRDALAELLRDRFS